MPSQFAREDFFTDVNSNAHLHMLRGGTWPISPTRVHSRNLHNRYVVAKTNHVEADRVEDLAQASDVKFQA